MTKGLRLKRQVTFSSSGQSYSVEIVLTSTFLFLSVLCHAEGIVTITFDGPPVQPPNSSYSITNYGESGTRFAGRFGRTGPGSTNRPDNGTTYISPTAPPATCSRFDSLSFRLVSVDLAGYSVVVPDHMATFEGHRAVGSVVSTNFAVSGIMFQTYHFSPAFGELTNVVITAGALDNLKMQLPSIQPVLRMGIYQYRSDSWVILEVQGTLGLRYRLEHADGLPTTNWNVVTNFVSSFLWMDHISQTIPPRRFFRAVELP